MKQLIYLIIICFIVFVNVNKAIANTIKNEILITNSFTGEKYFLAQNALHYRNPKLTCFNNRN